MPDSRYHRLRAPAIALDAPGVLKPLGLEGRGKHEATFYTAQYTVPVTCALTPPEDLDGKVWRAQVHLRELPNGMLVVETAQRDDSLDPLTLISPGACRLQDVVQEFLGFAASIKTAPLRRLLSEVFTQARVFEYFWAAPAAPDHHHWRCGLAWHTLELLRGVDAAMTRLPPGGEPWTPVERDLAIVAASLHDVAECVDGGEPSTREVEARRRACAIRHHELIAEPLLCLGRSNRELANALLDLWVPGIPAQRGNLRVDMIRAVLLAWHCRSEASTVRPMPNPSAVALDRAVGITRH